MIRFLSIFFFSFFWNSIYAQLLTKEQELDIKFAAKSFTSALSLYAKCNGINQEDLAGQVLTHKDGDDPRNYFMNDFFSDGEEHLENIDWFKYLRLIDEKYQCNIIFDFQDQDFQILNCIATENNSSYAIVMSEKKISFQGMKNNVIQLIFINLSNYLITEIVSTEFYRSKSRSCSNAIPQKLNDDDAEIKRLRNLADEYFQKKDFITAKNYYLTISKRRPEDISINIQIKECDKFITILSKVNRADSLYALKKYDDALSVYQEVLDKTLIINRDDIAAKITSCRNEIARLNYEKNINYADKFYDRGIFKEALKFYEIALTYIPSDSYAKTKIKKCRSSDPGFILGRIRAAANLAEKGKQNYAEAFKEMFNYELSGLLTTENYYFLTMMMIRQYKEVRKKMNFSPDDCTKYLKIFVKKLKDKYKTESNGSIREYVDHLLTEVINKYYQN